MALVVADRVQETTSTTGTSSYALLGAEAGYQSFGDVMANSDTTYYAVTDDVDWEVGIGTYSTTGPTLARTTILASSNSDAAVNWGVGVKKIFLTYAANRAVYLSANGDLAVDGTTLYVDGTNNRVGIGTVTPAVLLHVSGTTTATAEFTAVINGTYLDVSGVTSGTLAVGDIVYGEGVSPITRITALGTGTGGTGSYTVSVSNEYVSGTMYTGSGAASKIRIADTDTSSQIGQPAGSIEFFGSDASSPGAGVVAYISAVSESDSPDTALTFGTRTADSDGVDANERMRISSAGHVGVGVVPDAWRSSLQVVQVGTSALAGGQEGGFGGGDIALLSFNTANEGGGVGYRRIAEGYSSYYKQTETRHEWATDTTYGSAGDPNTFSEFMALSGTCVLSIGSYFEINSAGSVVPRLQVHGLGDESSQSIGRWSDDDASSALYLQKSRGTFIGGGGAVTSGDGLGTIFFAGDTNTAYVNGASIRAVVDGTVTSTTLPARLEFSTTAVGASTPSEAMRITPAGNVGIGTTTPATKLDVNGTASAAFFENPQTITSNYTIVTGKSAMNTGPITIASGVTITVESGARYVVI